MHVKFINFLLNRFIRVWVENIHEPLIELCDGFEQINCATWSPTSSTLIACTTSNKLKLWDLRTNCLAPVAIHQFNAPIYDTDSNKIASLTICKFTNCGQSIVVGTEDGIGFVFALEDMPFPSHFEYDTLNDMILRNLLTKPKLYEKIKQMEYLGYKYDDQLKV